MRRSSFADEEIFAELGAARRGQREFFAADSYSFRRLGKVESLDQKLLDRLKVARWRQQNRALLDSPEFRAAAAERSRLWLRAAMADPVKAEQVRAKVAKRTAAYRDRHRNEAQWKAMRAAADQRKYERIKADPARNAARKARLNAAARRRRAERKSSTADVVFERRLLGGNA